MSTSKSRKPWTDEGRPLDPQTLKECGAEIEITPKVDIFCGPIPDPANTGAYKTNLSSIARNGLTATCSSTTEADKFKAGDNVVIYDSTQELNPVFLSRSAIISVVGTTITFASPVKVIPRTAVLAKELVIRGSPKNCYRTDEYGIGRAYYAGLTSSEIETSMGDLFNYEWNTSDFTLQLQNYQGKFDKYLPGGENAINWGGRLIRVFLGTGEEFIKNKLVWEGITHFNAGLAEENQVLTLNAYHISYIYNVEINKNRFKTVLDSDYENKIIPIIYGDWTTHTFDITGGSFPAVPAVLVDKDTVVRAAKAIVPYQDAGKEKSFTITSTFDGAGNATQGNEYKVVLEFYDYIQPSNWDKSGALTMSNSNKTCTIKMFQGVDGSGVAFNSTKFVKDLIAADLIAGARFVCANESPVPMRDYGFRGYKNTSYSNYSYYESNAKETVEYALGGGQVTANCEYKISANPLSAGTQAWFCKGSPDDLKSWESSASKMGGQTITVEWDLSNGRVFIKDIPALDIEGEALDVTDYKLFVKVKGEILGIKSRRKDDKVFLNFAHNEEFGIQNKCNAAKLSQTYGWGGLSEFKTASAFTFGTGYDLKGAQLNIQFSNYSYADNVRTSNYKFYYKYEYNYHYYQMQTLDNTKDFIFECELNPQVTLLNGSEQIFLALSNPELSKYAIEIGMRENKPIVYFNNRSKKVITTGTTLTEGTSYRLKVIKESNTIKVYVKDLDLNTSYTECSYIQQDSWAALDNSTIYYAELGYSTYGAISSGPESRSMYKGRVGVLRFANNTLTFADSEFVDYANILVADNDPVTMAKRLLQLGGVPRDLFDETFEQYRKDNLVDSYNCRMWIGEENLKAVEEATKLLGQIGMVLTMKPRDGKLKFSLIWDNIDHYQNNDQLVQITDFDIEQDSLVTDPEVNQYFNFCDAEFNYIPAADEMNEKSLPYYDPNALLRDSGIQMWYKIEEKEKLSIELPNLYDPDDVEARLKDCLVISVCNPEMITVKLSWRHLFLELGQFVILNFGRYKNIPCQVRDLKIDANGSNVEVKLMSLQNINFKDSESGVEYIPENWDGVGGWNAKGDIINSTDAGDI